MDCTWLEHRSIGAWPDSRVQTDDSQPYKHRGGVWRFERKRDLRERLLSYMCHFEKRALRCMRQLCVLAASGGSGGEEGSQGSSCLVSASATTEIARRSASVALPARVLMARHLP